MQGEPLTAKLNGKKVTITDVKGNTVLSFAQEVQHMTGETVKIAFVDQGYTGQEPARAAKEEGIKVHVIKLQEAKKALSCCRAVGLSSAASDGPIVQTAGTRL